MVPSSTSSRIQCYQTLICLERLWNWGFRAIAIDPSLSPRISVGISSFSKPNSEYKFLSQHASRDASERATYSACVDDRAVETCFFELQVMAPSPARKTYPVVDLRSLALAYVASAYPWKKLGCNGSALYMMPWVRVPDRYLRTCFNAVECWRLGFAV